MNAMDQTMLMLRWWWAFGIEVADLAVRRTSGEMCWHLAVATNRLPLGWARAENVRGADVYVRPDRSRAWPLVFLDDVPLPVARRVVRKYGALAIETSSTGGCHLWLPTARALGEEERKAAQRWLASRVGADPASTSGEHLGRLAGFKNWKRGGTWVNVVAAHRGRPWAPPANLTAVEQPPPSAAATTMRNTDTSASAREWGWVCGRLETGSSPALVYEELVEAARHRRGKDAARYARHTVTRACRHVFGKPFPPSSSAMRGELR